jgi:homoserine dehydrogenase
MVVRLVGIATLADERVDVRVQPAFVVRSHPLAAVDGAFNAVMLQGDAIREITLEGPGAGGTETASAVVADLVSVVGTVVRDCILAALGVRTRTASARASLPAWT